MEINRGLGDAIKGPDDRFLGDVWLWPRLSVVVPGLALDIPGRGPLDLFRLARRR